MRALILGGTGMLGHRLWMNLQRVHEVWVTVRGDGNPFPAAPEFPAGRILHRIDGLASDDVIRALASVRPDVVINCIGLIKQTELAKDPVLSLSLNALLPHRLSWICQAAGVRLIHISTDCVYSGRKGNYVEDDLSDAEDLYGRTKSLGEVQASHAVTLRTSIIGQELKGRLGLIEWFLSQAGTIRGYRKAIYSGVTTDELSRVILERVMPNQGLHGVYHVSSGPISKYELLVLARDAYARKHVIVPDDQLVCDRTLDSTRFRQATGYAPASWPEMIRELASHAAFYERWCRAAAPSP